MLWLIGGMEKPPNPQKKRSLSKQIVGRQGVSLLRRRPLRRFVPCALRW